MGYETYYALRITKNESKKSNQDIIKEFRESCEMADGAFDRNGDYEDPIKWYDHEKDVAVFSQRYPDVVFKLHGVGEAGGDMWYKYFKNGKVQFCPALITFDDYDESKLGIVSTLPLRKDKEENKCQEQ